MINRLPYFRPGRWHFAGPLPHSGHLPGRIGIYIIIRRLWSYAPFGSGSCPRLARSASQGGGAAGNRIFFLPAIPTTHSPPPPPLAPSSGAGSPSLRVGRPDTLDDCSLPPPAPGGGFGMQNRSAKIPIPTPSPASLPPPAPGGGLVTIAIPLSVSEPTTHSPPPPPLAPSSGAGSSSLGVGRPATLDYCSLPPPAPGGGFNYIEHLSTSHLLYVRPQLRTTFCLFARYHLPRPRCAMACADARSRKGHPARRLTL